MNHNKHYHSFYLKSFWQTIYFDANYLEIAIDPIYMRNRNAFHLISRLCFNFCTIQIFVSEIRIGPVWQCCKSQFIDHFYRNLI